MESKGVKGIHGLRRNKILRHIQFSDAAHMEGLSRLLEDFSTRVDNFDIGIVSVPSVSYGVAASKIA